MAKLQVLTSSKARLSQKKNLQKLSSEGNFCFRIDVMELELFNIVSYT